MHPHIEHLANQAHVDDLRREAELQRRQAQFSRRQARRVGQLVSPALPPLVRDVLVFAEHQPSQSQLAQVLEQLKGLHDDVVTALMLNRSSSSRMVREPGRRRVLPASTARIQAQRTPPVTEQQLLDVVEALRAAGHQASGELVAGSVPRVLLAHVRQHRPEAVILMTDRHRLAHLARRDLERRLRHHTDARVVTVVDGEPLQPV